MNAQEKNRRPNIFFNGTAVIEVHVFSYFLFFYFYEVVLCYVYYSIKIG